MRGAGRKDHSLLRDDTLQESLIDHEDDGTERKKERATMLRLLGLARKEVWVSTGTPSTK